jgi:hypothetical protein
MAADGHTFSQSARVQNISWEGALLTGVEPVLKVGDVIGLQYEGKKARCQVVSTMNAGGIKKNQVGIKLVADQECPWKSSLPQETKPVPTSPSNRRRFRRHKITLPIEIREGQLKAPLRVNATDVSGNGCYVEVMVALPVGAQLLVNFWIGSDRVHTPAMVRTCDPGVGNGIEFIGLDPEAKIRLQAYLDAIDPPMGVVSRKM